jgi:hypothetical protein
LNSFYKNHLYLSIAISCVLFNFLNFILGPTSVFGLAEFLQNKIGYFFGVDINTFDYFLIASIPLFGLLLNSKRKENGLAKILKDILTIILSCMVTFSVGLFILITKIGSPGENPLIPEYLRVEPFKEYSSFIIAFGIVLPFLLIKKNVEKAEDEFEEIGMENK